MKDFTEGKFSKSLKLKFGGPNLSDFAENVFFNSYVILEFQRLWQITPALYKSTCNTSRIFEFFLKLSALARAFLLKTWKLNREEFWLIERPSILGFIESTNGEGHSGNDHP